MVVSPTIEKLFLEYINEMRETPGGFMDLLEPEAIKEDHHKTLGKKSEE